jgi:hypothetical protein
MSAFDSGKTSLKDLLNEIVEGKLQLPDFQRGWVWDDEHIRSLLISIARSFPIGAVMLLETGGDVRFQVRPVEGVSLPNGNKAERLILDGQQRLTSLAQVLKLLTPVTTQDANKREIKRYYYFDIEKALSGPATLDDVIVGVPEDKIVRTNFGRDVLLDLSTRQKEYENFCFPCSQVMVSDEWEDGLMAKFSDRFSRYMEFRRLILNEFRSYQVPIIELKKETSKEAVCLVFEKVNTGGVQLSVFELVTATYAADGFNLRRDWYGEGQEKGRHAKLAPKALLKDTAATDFLQGISLLHTYEVRQQDIAAGKTGKAITPVSAKREHILQTPLAAYKKWADKLVQGFFEADQFLRLLGFHDPRFLPYRPQLVPLAAVLAQIGDRWLEPQIQSKLAQWFWCGVFGELYGSAAETRVALDFQELLKWFDDDSAPLPKTVIDAGFQATRLESMRSRTSAAYRGLYVLVQHNGAEDFFWKIKMVDLDRNEKGIDIHHIFPRKWCEDAKISGRIFNSIINKTAISYRANRKIGGKAPSLYLQQVQTDKAVQLTDPAMDAILRTHFIEPTNLRADNFEAFFSARRSALLNLVESAMGKQAVHNGIGMGEQVADEAEDELEINGDEMEMGAAGGAA